MELIEQELLNACYSINQELPHGFLGQTFLITNLNTKENFIAKIFDKTKLGNEKAIFDFQKRLDQLKTLKLPNLVSVKEYIETQTNFVVIRPYLAALNLIDFMTSIKYIDQDKTLAIWKKVFSLFEKLHQHSISPSFIKPANIFILSNEVYVTDIYEVPHDISFSMQNPDLESLVFMAPEFFDPVVEPGIHSDIWSLAVLLIYMTTGIVPWSTKNIFLMLKTMQSKNFVLPETISDYARRVADAVFKVEPLQRKIPVDPTPKQNGSKSARSSERPSLVPNISPSSINELQTAPIDSISSLRKIKIRIVSPPQ